MAFVLGLLLAIVSYGSPVNYEISLAGNFGEPRPNHFHGGIDVKTGGVEGKPLFSIGDGYVSAVTIGVGGFGNAVYVRHPEGYTSVYCHLRKFTPQITAMVRKWQYANRRWSGEIRFRPTDLPVSRGQLIAISGNTGSSQAPHLHLEIHDTRTWNMLDPLDFVGDKMNDNLAPMAHGFMAYPVQDEGVFCNSSSKQTYGFGSRNLTQKFTAWGKVGFGIWANDYMEITYNRYGVRKTELLVDDSLVFRSDVNNIPVNMNMQVNAWGDYDHLLRSNVWYMRSFILPGVTLPVLWGDANRGVIDFNQEREYHITYLLTDYKGNQSKYTFVVTGQKNASVRGRRYPTSQMLRMRAFPNRRQCLQLPDLELVVAPSSLAEDASLQPKATNGSLSACYTLTPKSFQLFNYGKIKLRLRKDVPDKSKLYIVSHFGTDRYMGGTYSNGWVTGRIRELGASYEIAYDDTPPQVAVSLNPTSGTLTASITDTESGIKSYEAFIDDQFVLFGDASKAKTLRPNAQSLICKLQETPIRKLGRERRFTFVARDNRNNVRIIKKNFTY